MNLRDKVEAAILQGWGVINLDEGEPYREQEADINRSIEAILTLIRSTVEEVINPCLEYCQEQNGLPYCKNCGLDREQLNKIMGE